MKIPAKYWIPGSLILAIIGAEIILRFAFGLGNPPLVIADRKMGYRFQENQNLRRFGNRLQYNQYSQRSEPILLSKPPETLRILMLGDSVLNGGNRKDQSEIISEQWEARIKQKRESVEVLNASANSWGIGNQLGYINQYGLFNSDVIVLQIGTHDLLQKTSTEESLTDNDRPIFALQETIFSYIWPQVKGKLLKPRNSLKPANSQPNLQQQQDTQKQQFEDNLNSLDAIASLARANNLPIFVLYTPDRRDLLPEANEPPYKAQFLQHLAALKIPVIDSHAAWSKLPPETIESYFIDKVHLSVAGNDAIADLLFQQLCVEGQISACQN
jgi:lysophospholipase L1-like esterase